MSLPPSSPRLPSPPPPAEIQRTPKSPLMGPNAARQTAQIEQTAIDTNAKRRIHPGTKSAEMAAGPPLVPLHELDSAFQLQEHLAALHYYHTASHTTPISRDTAKVLATPPPGIDKTLWLYELCRFLIAQCNTLIVGFLFDTPPCSAATCPEMRAGEWQFLCAVHDAPKSCCAIDYCCHTLDWATNVVTNPKIFPSRFVVDAHDKNTALKNLVNVFRRLHRIFAHAWFQHRGVFWSVEGQGGLYVFFKTVCDVYDLLPAENYKLPPEAEGLDSNTGAGDLGDRNDRRPQQQQQPQQLLGPISIAKPPAQRDAEDGDYSMNRNNTRRHIKSSPSTGSAVTTVPEADEDDSSDLSHRLRGMRISAPPSVAEEERESANIPVIVEHKPMAAGEHPVRPPSVIPPPGAESDESQPKQKPVPAPAPEVAMQEAAEAPGPEHEFAAEPEAPTQEHQPEPEPEPKPGGEEEAQSTEEPNTAPATTEEPAPESKEPEPEPQEAASTAEASGEPDAEESDAETVIEPAEKSVPEEAPSYLPLTDEKKDEQAPEPDAEPQAATTAASSAAQEKDTTEGVTTAGEEEEGEAGQVAPTGDAKTEAEKDKDGEGTEADTAAEESERGAEEKPAGVEPTEDKKPVEEKGDQD
ncbi:Mob1/phocein [Chaetomium fimeti]|uniref:Mob1/phocein n=1 Tax=Chaetomium fimeti TaxID=1854472 RepID=A0AAE0HE17_9PEZI|nr:Mob1/phocein [Chaetomium fimeti]